MNRVSTLQYLTIGAGLIAIILIGSVELQHPAALYMSLAAILAMFVFLAAMADVSPGVFAIDQRSGLLVKPGGSILRVHGDIIYSRCECSFEFSPWNDGTFFLVAYKVPVLEALAATQELIRRGVSLQQYVEDQVRIATCDIEEYDRAGLEAVLRELREDFAEQGVELQVSVQVREEVVCLE